MKRDNWGSKFGFILAASGSAVGLGNIWRFPYTAGQNGGALFVLIYLIAIALLAFPVLLGEVALGRFTKKNPVGAYGEIKKGFFWKIPGYLGVLTGFMILSYYSVVAGWTIGYFFKSLTSKLRNINQEGAETLFNSFVSNTSLQIILLAFFILLTLFIVSKGISGGIEKFSKIFMPLLFFILIALMIRSLTLSGASKGISFYLAPDFSKLNSKVIIDAMGQAFFSLSLGMGTMITYGSYLSKRENLLSACGWIAFFDTFIAFVAGLIIFPAIFAMGGDPASGPGLVFQTLPVIFAKMPGGAIFGSLFFALLSIAALTSTVSVLEVPVSYFIDEKKWSRKKSAWIIGSISFLIGIPSALSQGANSFLSKLPIINMSFFELWDTIWGNLSLTLGALFLSVFLGYVWKTHNLFKEIGEGKIGYYLGKTLTVLIAILVPFLIIIILITLISQFFSAV